MPKRESVFIAAAIGLFAVAATLAENSATYRSEQVESLLRQRLSVAWHGQQLGTVFKRLADTQGLVFWLDRRVDPQQMVELRLDDASLERVLESLVKKQSLGFATIGGVVYVGPEASARELLTLSQLAHEMLDSLPSSTKKRWLQNDSCDWARLTIPRALLAKLLDDADFKLAAEGLIPHDLWAAKRLPSVSLIDRVLLILVGFDLTCEVSSEGTVCAVVPIQHPVTIKREYQLTRNREELLNKIDRAISDGKIEVDGRRVTYSGFWEDHLRIQKILDRRTGTSPKRSRQSPRTKERRYSLELANQPVGTIIGQLAKQLKLEVTWDDASLAAAKKSRDERISCDVKNADLDELLESILSPAGMRSKREGYQIKIEAKK